MRSGYNPPQFVIDAAKAALDRVECNQYSPTKVCRWGRETHAVIVAQKERVVQKTTMEQEAGRRVAYILLEGGRLPDPSETEKHDLQSED